MVGQSPAYIHIKALPGELPATRTQTHPNLLLKFVQFCFSVFGWMFPTLSAKIAYRLFATPRFRAVHKKSDELLETARLFEVLYVKRILKAYEWGSGDKTVLLVHGWESRGTALRSFVPPLVEAGYKVVTFDGPAHGDSEGKRTNIVHFGGAVLAVIRHVGQVESIICHSFGGAATVFALSQVKPSIPIEKIVLVSTPAKMTKVFEGARRTMRLPANVYRKLLGDFEKIVNMSIEQVNISHLHATLPVEKALIVHDVDDKVVSYRYSCQVAEAWEEASLVSTEGMGHFMLVKHPKVIEEVTNFLTGQKTYK